MKQEPISCRADNALAARCQSFAARWACVLKRSIFYLAACIDNNVIIIFQPFTTPFKLVLVIITKIDWQSSFTGTINWKLYKFQWENFPFNKFSWGLMFLANWYCILDPFQKWRHFTWFRQVEDKHQNKSYVSEDRFEGNLIILKFSRHSELLCGAWPLKSFQQREVQIVSRSKPKNQALSVEPSSDLARPSYEGRSCSWRYCI